VANAGATDPRYLPAPGGMWDASLMPWVPEFFSAPALARLEQEPWRDDLAPVSYFAGLIAGEPDALVKSFAGEPELAAARIYDDADPPLGPHT
jgi:hypothetical protein